MTRASCRAIVPGVRIPVLALFATCSLPGWIHASEPARIDCPAVSEDAQRLRQQSKYRAARAQFQACAAESCPGVVRRDCAVWVTELATSMPSIVVAGVDEQDRDLIDAELAIDGEIVAYRLDGKPVDIDPGSHELRITASQRFPSTAMVVIRAGEKNRVVRMKFASKAVVAGTAVVPDSPSLQPSPSPSPGALAPRYSSAPPAGAVVVGALGFTMAAASVPLFATENATSYAATLLGLGLVLVGTGGLWWGIKASTPLPAQISAGVTPLPGGGFGTLGARF